MKPYFVGISGRQGAGKTILAQLLAGALNRQHGVDARVRALADPIKEAAAVLTGDPTFDKRGVYPVGGQGAPMAGRELLQWLGTDVCRGSLRQDIWIYLLQMWAERSGAQVVIIDDVRFPDEAQACDFHVFLESDGEAPQQGDGHASESHLNFLRLRADAMASRSEDHYASVTTWAAAAGIDPIVASIARLLRSGKPQPGPILEPSIAAGMGGRTHQDRSLLP